MRHGAVLPREELQDHVFPARIDTRHPAAAAELGDLEDLSVHVFQECEIVAAVTRDGLFRRSISRVVFMFRQLGEL